MNTLGPWNLPATSKDNVTNAIVRDGLKAPDLRDALQNLIAAIQNRENNPGFASVRALERARSLPNPGFASAINYVRALERARSLLED